MLCWASGSERSPTQLAESRYLVPMSRDILSVASIVTNQCVYDEFYGYFECLNIVFVFFSLPFGHYLFCFVFPTLGIRVISCWD